MQAVDPDQQAITLEGDDGRSYACRLLGVFQFDNKEYALLLKLGEEDGPESSGTATVIMRFIEADGQAIFRTIESDEEFDRVVAFVKDLAAKDSA